MADIFISPIDSLHFPDPVSECTEDSNLYKTFSILTADYEVTG